MTPVSKRIPPRADNKYSHQGTDLPLLPLRSGLAVKTICGKKKIDSANLKEKYRNERKKGCALLQGLQLQASQYKRMKKE